MKKSQKCIHIVAIIMMLAITFCMGGCGKNEDGSLTSEEVLFEISELQGESLETGTDEDAGQMGDTGGIGNAASEQNWDTGLPVSPKTPEEWEKEDRERRAALEEQVQAAGGISEERAIEIAEKALETDIGERGKELELSVNETYGWRSDLCVADWSEIPEKDRGVLAYSVGFDNAQSAADLDELLNYCCVVNAVDGSILEAYEIQGWDNIKYYEH